MIPILQNYRLKHGLHWLGVLPIREVVQWMKAHWRMFLLLWVISIAVIYVLHLHSKNLHLADLRLAAVDRLDDVYGGKMSGAPCTLASDYEDGKCIEVPDLNVRRK